MAADSTTNPFWMLSVRVIPPLVVVVLAMLAFQSGVDVSDRGEIPDHDLFAQLYYSIGLFALGGMDLGMPTGGPPHWRGVLWCSYFLAPMIAAAAVIDGLVRALHPWLTRNWRWQNHIVIAGAGRVSSACVEVMRKRHPRVNILVVEPHPSRSNWHRLKSLPRVYGIQGDIRDKRVIARLRLQRSRCLLLLTNDELANIEVAVQLRDAGVHPGTERLPILVRVSDLTLLRAARPVLSDTTVLVNLHEGVATNFHESCADHIRRTRSADVVVLAGFGRFSQTFLHCFLADASHDEIGEIHIIDLRAERCWATFCATLPADQRDALEAKRHIHVGAIDDPRMWDRVLSQQGVRACDDNVVVVLGTCAYGKNLQAGLVLRAKLPAAFIAVRTFDRSAFASRIEETHSLTVVYAADEMKDRIAMDWLPRLGL